LSLPIQKAKREQKEIFRDFYENLAEREREKYGVARGKIFFSQTLVKIFFLLFVSLRGQSEFDRKFMSETTCRRVWLAVEPVDDSKSQTVDETSTHLAISLSQLFWLWGDNFPSRAEKSFSRAEIFVDFHLFQAFTELICERIWLRRLQPMLLDYFVMIWWVANTFNHFISRSK
jgi:hypothetical protein